MLIFRKIWRVHPLVKFILFINLNLLIFFGSIYISIILSFLGYSFLIFSSKKNQFYASPHKSLIFCIVTFLLVYLLMENTQQELKQLIFFTLKLFAIIITSIIAGLFIKPLDLVYFLKTLRIRKKDYPMIFSIIRFIPVTISDLENIVFAQRSRGFNYNIKSIFNKSTYLSIVIPYIYSILNHVVQTDISLEIKDFNLKTEKIPVSLIDILIIAINILLWYVPEYLPVT